MALPSKPATHQPTVVLADDKERIRAPVKLTSLRAGKPRRQPQRWTEERVVSELRAFIARHGDEGIMPTRFCLESHDRSDLAVAIERRFGGLRKLASRMDLAMTGRHEQRHWSSFEVVERALRDFIAANGTRDLMPSSLQLREHGRNDLLLAIRSHGGLRAVANRTGMRLRPALLAKRFDWADWDVLASELFAFVATNGTSGVMPSAAELRTHGRGKLVHAIHKHHGGQKAVAARLGLRRRARAPEREQVPRGFWVEPANLERELLAYARGARAREVAAAARYRGVPLAHVAAEASTNAASAGARTLVRAAPLDAAASPPSSAPANERPLTMPTSRALVAAGRTDLHRAICAHGGYFEVAARYGLERRDGRRRKNWADKDVLRAELLRYIAENGTVGEMPSHDQLQIDGRTDLLSAMAAHHGSMRLVGEALGLKPHDGFTFHDWQQWENVERELRAFVLEREARGFPKGLMPTALELRMENKTGLTFAIKQHRGFYNVARRMRLYCPGGYDETLGSARVAGLRGAARVRAFRGRPHDDDDDDDGAAAHEDARRAEAELLLHLRRQYAREKAMERQQKLTAAHERDGQPVAAYDANADSSGSLGPRDGDRNTAAEFG
ncbi:hypothetical protein KFE25_005120 [Diacronema lutheri]|uniref:Uncharacterized protein n=1 Tax=Diacronema lutheri TaxID=2081491 RepID=A0A8J6C3Y2_DIALT|nr:hypothetical protein KFE25_005120 [Diacronema lutheri]